MSSILGLPDWLPAWAQILTLVVGILFALAFALMPFSVFGLKSRLESIEARLDEVQGELRRLVLRLPDESRWDATEPQPGARRGEAAVARPPVPPTPPWSADAAPRRPIGAGRAEAAATRAEPRLGRP
jgi:hypothetical protein